MRVLALFIAALLATTANAVQFSGSQTGPNTWTYTLTYDAGDNYGVCQSDTTITVNGMVGVTGAGAPTSTDYTPTGGPADLNNLGWAPQVLNGGTTVTWTHTGGYGTGNMGSAMHVYGFTITANATSGQVPFLTDGFAIDGNCPATVIDIAGNVAGPAAPVAMTTVPTLSDWSLAILSGMLVLASIAYSRRRNS